MSNHLARVIVFVGDVQKCATFYRDAFGLAMIPTDDPDGWQELDAGGANIAFHKAFGPDGPIDTPTGSPNSPHKLTFHVDDVPAMRRQLAERGIEMFDVFEMDPAMICDGLDPEGHRFQISSR